MRNFLAAAVMLLAAGSTIAAAQESQGQESKNEVAGTIGRTFVSDVTPPNTNFFDNTVHSGKGLSFEGDYARTLRRYFWGDLAVEIPIIINPEWVAPVAATALRLNRPYIPVTQGSRNGNPGL